MDCETPGCRRTRSLHFEPDGWVCVRHVTAEQHAQLADLDERGKAIGIKSGEYWPYGPNVYVDSRADMVTWAEREGLKLSPRGDCLHWLTRGRRNVALCERGDHGWMDHVTGWNRDGKPAVLVAQPYGLTQRELAQLGALPDVDVRIDGTGWYGAGTTFVTVLPRAGGGQ